MGTYFKLKGLSEHFAHDSFSSYFSTVFPPTSKEARLAKELVAIKNEKVGTRQQEEIEKAKAAIEDQLDPREQLEAKERRLWFSNETKIQAVLIACAATRFHMNILGCKSSVETTSN